LGASLGIGDGGSYKNNPGFGESVAAWTVAGLLIPGGGEEKAGVEAAEELVAVSRWGREGLQDGDWVMNGPKNIWNYTMSGKYQRGFGNQYAPYSSGSEYLVPSSSLKMPNEPIFGVVKGWLGQRIYSP
jgi:hypothetical protein